MKKKRLAYFRLGIIFILLASLFGGQVFAEASGKPGTPVLSQDKYGGENSYTITMNMWWGQNGTSWKLYENGQLVHEASLTDNSPNAQTASKTFSGKAPGKYEYTAELINSYGITSTTSALTYTVTQTGGGETPTPTPTPTTTPKPTPTPGPDKEAPTAPASLTVTNQTSTTVSLSWKASTDNVGVTGYNIFQGSTLVGSTTNTYFTVTGLSANTTYTFTVKAKDAAGNLSAASNEVTVKTNEQPGPSTGKKIVGYYTEWSVYAGHNNYYVSDIPWDKVTHINYAFAKPAPDGSIGVFDSWAATEMSFPGDTWDQPLRGNFNQLNKYKKQYPNVKVLISIGGWTLSGHFSDIAADPAKREKFADSSVEFIRKYGFDGVDIDWEYPGQPGDPGTNNKYRPEDKQNFTLLLAKVREKLDAASKADGRENDKYQLTIAAPAGPAAISTQDPGAYAKYLDHVNIMTYDYHGSWENITNHQSAVYKNPDDPNKPEIANNYNVDATAAKFEELGVPKEKIIIGTPYYSRGWMGVDDKTGTNGLFAKAVPGPKKGPCGIWDSTQGDCGGQNPYYHFKSNMEKDSSFVKYRDPISKAPWLYSRSKKEMYTYEDEESLAFKADYINSKGYGGAIIWELAGDAPLKGSSLTTVLYNKLLKGK